MPEITQKLIPVPSQRRSGQKLLGVRFIVAHDTGNDGSTAAGNASYFTTSANDMQASAHYFVDDKQIICVVPETEKAWHVRYDVPKDNQLYGKDANDWALGIELCFSSKETIDNEKSYQNYVGLMASLCKKYGLDPAKDIVAHGTLDPARRTDPINAFNVIGKTWDGFIAAVVGAMSPVTPPTPPSPIPASNTAIVDEIRTHMTAIDTLLGKIK